MAFKKLAARCMTKEQQRKGGQHGEIAHLWLCIWSRRHCTLKTRLVIASRHGTRDQSAFKARVIFDHVRGRIRGARMAGTNLRWPHSFCGIALLNKVHGAEKQYLSSSQHQNLSCQSPSWGFLGCLRVAWSKLCPLNCYFKPNLTWIQQGCCLNLS